MMKCKRLMMDSSCGEQFQVIRMRKRSPALSHASTQHTRGRSMLHSPSCSTSMPSLHLQFISLYDLVCSIASLGYVSKPLLPRRYSFISDHITTSYSIMTLHPYSITPSDSHPILPQTLTIMIRHGTCHLTSKRA